VSSWLRKYLRESKDEKEFYLSFEFLDELLRRLGEVMAEFYKGNYSSGMDKLSELGEEIYSFYKSLINEDKNVKS